MSNLHPLPRPTRIIDSHTAGEPTRLVLSGGPDLGGGSMQERRQRFSSDHDHWRRALVNEPRGNDVLVGALWCEPQDPSHAGGVIFFNNVGFIGMCGHGTIGLVATLAHLGRLQPGPHAIETPVGLVWATLHADRSVTVANVPAFRHRRQVALDLPDGSRVHGDVAWGGNWFFLCHDHGLPVQASHIAALSARAQLIAVTLQAQGVTGAAGAAIDHVELLGPALNPLPVPPHATPRAAFGTELPSVESERHDVDANHRGRSFVLCPGGAYDRSPCGTGTSAKLACLAADGELAPGQRWRQESVIGTEFVGHYEWAAAAPGEPPHIDPYIHPYIHGRAHVTLDATVVFDADDALTWGMA